MNLKTNQTINNHDVKDTQINLPLRTFDKKMETNVKTIFMFSLSYPQ